MTKTGLALVGCGAISEWHRIGLASVPALEIRAVVDPVRERAEAMAKKTGAAAFTSLDDAFAAGGIDAADVMVPHHLHEPIALEVLRAGKHLLLEKPMATSIAACERMLGAALLGDFASVYLAFLNGADPSPMPEIDLLKQRLAARP